MNIHTDLVLVKYSDVFVKVAFWVTRYPVTRGDFLSLAEDRLATPEEDSRLHRTTWRNAIQYCNRLSSFHHLPHSYCEDTGQLIDRAGEPATELSSVGGFRLPTLREWEYAAHGWSGRKTGDYFALHKQHYKVPFQDFPTTELQREHYERGYSRKEDLVANHLGLYGLLAYGREWFADCGSGAAPNPSVCRWEEYFMNYNNDIGYQVAHQTCWDTDEHAFRVVVNEQDFAGSTGAA